MQPHEPITRTSGPSGKSVRLKLYLVVGRKVSLPTIFDPSVQCCCRCECIGGKARGEKWIRTTWCACASVGVALPQCNLGKNGPPSYLSNSLRHCHAIDITLYFNRNEVYYQEAIRRTLSIHVQHLIHKLSHIAPIPMMNMDLNQYCFHHVRCWTKSWWVEVHWYRIFWYESFCHFCPCFVLKFALEGRGGGKGGNANSITKHTEPFITEYLAPVYVKPRKILPYRPTTPQIMLWYIAWNCVKHSTGARNMVHIGNRHLSIKHWICSNSISAYQLFN